MSRVFEMAALIVFVSVVVSLCTGCPPGRAAADVSRACTAPLAALDVEYGFALTEACERSVDECEATKLAYAARYDAVAEECSK